MTPETAVNWTAALTAIICFVAFAIMCVSDATKQDWPMFALTLSGTITLMIFAIGYGAITIGIPVNTAVLFRPTFVAMALLFTMTAAWLHINRALSKARIEALEAAARVGQMRDEIAALVENVL